MDSLIALVLAGLISMMALKPYLQMNNSVSEKTVAATTAGQFKILLSGAKKYADIHSQALLDTIPVGAYAPIQLTTLAQENRIPNSFSATNPYGQQWAVYLSQPVSGSLQAIVMTWNGQTLSGVQSVDIASMTGAEGGYVPFNGMLGNLNAGTAVGAGGSWQFPLPGNLNPGPGHLFGLVASANNTENTADYLYRNAVANHPELQTLNAPLNMNGNNINHSGDLHSYGTLSAGNNADQNAVNAFMSSDGRINATKDIRGQIFRPNYIAQSGEACDGVAISTGALDGTASNNAQDTFTTQNGDLAKDSHGNTLNCVDGSWKILGAAFATLIQDSCTGSDKSTTNDTGLPVLVEAEVFGGHKGATADAYVNGESVGHVEWSGDNSRVDQTMTFVVPPNQSWYISPEHRVDEVCYHVYK